MINERRWYVGVDWASESHHVFLTDAAGAKLVERILKLGGEGLAETAAWLIATADAAEPEQLHEAIEVPHGPVAETLIERRFNVYSINPKQMDRFRDRFTLAGAKDDSRDAEMMASALRTDSRCFRSLAANVLETLRKEPATVADGTIAAPSARITTLIARIRLLSRQGDDAHRRLDRLTAELASSQKSGSGQVKQHDAEILASLPRVGRIVLATLLTEAFDALQRRDYATPRGLTGVAPVTKKSAKNYIDVRRQACNNRLSNAAYDWAHVAMRHGQTNRSKYAALRGRCQSRCWALRPVADGLLNVACAMLKTGTTFNPSRAAEKATC